MSPVYTLVGEGVVVTPSSISAVCEMGEGRGGVICQLLQIVVDCIEACCGEESNLRILPPNIRRYRRQRLMVSAKPASRGTRRANTPGESNGNNVKQVGTLRWRATASSGVQPRAHIYFGRCSGLA
jgi:hypothetical protein